MSRRVKEFVDIGEHVSLDELIGKLVAVRDGLPNGSEAELRLRGDEVFGHRITISYLRDQTEEERNSTAAIPKRAAKRRSVSCSGCRKSLAWSATPLRASAGRCGSSPRRSGGAEVERQPIHAITKARRLRAIIEHVPEAAAARAQHLRPLREQASVGPSSRQISKRAPEARPSGAAFELGG